MIGCKISLNLLFIHLVKMLQIKQFVSDYYLCKKIKHLGFENYRFSSFGIRQI